MSVVTVADLAWLGGMIDGEGNISCGFRNNPNGERYLEVKVRVSGNDIRMMHEVGRIYQALNLRFFNSLMNKRTNWATGINVEVARQRSTKKLLKLVRPYLRGKREVADAVINVIEYVQSVPRSGNGVRRNYATHEEFQRLLNEYDAARKWYRDPSTITRKAGEPISLDGMI